MSVKGRFLPQALALFLASNASAIVHYVDLNSANPASPYTNWSTAAVTIQDAIDSAANGDEVLVTNGVYQTGGRVGYGMSNRVTITKPLLLKSVNGPEVTAIRGYQMPDTTNGPNAIRCVFATNGATLSGFTIFGGATHDSHMGFDRFGGGICCTDTNALISNCIIVSNAANYGGGVAYGILQDCVLRGNVAVFHGGGAIFSKLSNCQLYSNHAGRWGGGAFGGVFDHCVIANNSAQDGGGMRESSAIYCIVTNNNASQFGGAASGGSTLQYCDVIGNSAYYGGGLNICSAFACRIVGNHATEVGGALTDGIAGNSLVVSNTAGVAGGGAYGNQLYNCVLQGNSTPGYGGATIGGRLYNCTIVDNSAGSFGGGAAYAALTNCIVYYNSAPDGSNYDTNSSLNHCCSVPSNGSPGTFTNEPLFIDRLNGNFRLQTSSPCIDTGTNLSGGTIDLDGRPRVVGSNIDVGAYEFQGPGMGEFIYWLQQNALATDGSVDYVDTDTDGLNNWQEWTAGTSPTNLLSVLRLLPPSYDVTGLTVRWESVTNRTYFLTRATSLESLRTSPVLVSNIVGQANLTIYQDSAATNSDLYFYQVGVQ